MLGIDYYSIPCSLLVVGGVVSVVCNRSGWALAIASLLSVVFLLGLVPGASEFPVSFPEHNHDYRIFGLVVAAAFGFLALEVKKLSAAEVVACATAVGVMELALLSNSRYLTVLLLEMVSLFSVFFIYKNDTRDAVGTAAFTVASIGAISAATAFLGTSIFKLDPPFILFGSRYTLADIVRFLTVVSLGSKGFLFSGLLPSIYAKEWRSEPVKCFVVWVLGLGAFVAITGAMRLHYGFASLLGALAIVCGSVAALAVSCPRKALAHSAMSSLGVLLVIRAHGGDNGLLYFVVSSISYLAGFFFLGGNVGRLWSVLGACIVFLPVLPLPSLPLFHAFSEVSLGGGSLYTSLISLHVTVYSLVVAFKLRGACGGDRSVVFPVAGLSALACSAGLISVALLKQVSLAKYVGYDFRGLRGVLEAMMGCMSGVFLGCLFFSSCVELGFRVRNALILSVSTFFCGALGGVKRFFCRGGVLAFDYLTKLLYTVRQFGSVASGCVGCSGGSSGAVVLFSSSLLGFVLWFFLIARCFL